MNVDPAGIFNELISHAGTLGQFEKINGHEPKAAPTTGGIVASFWVERFAPIQRRSGLNVTSMLLMVSCRIQTSMLQDPQDDIDPRVLNSAVALVGSMTGDFDLGGQIAQIDLLGAFWPNGLNGRAGYVDLGSTKYRVMLIEIPMIIDDVWTQVQ